MITSLTIKYPRMKNLTLLLIFLFSNAFSFTVNLKRADQTGISFSVENIVPDRKGCPLTQCWGLPKLEGFSNLGKPTYPNIPVKIFNVAIPFGSELALSSSVENTIILNDIYILPAESVYYKDNARENYERIYLENKSVYESRAYFPASHAEIVSITTFRSQRIASIAVYPLRYNPKEKKALLATSISISLNFTQPNPRNRFIDEGKFESILKDNLLNYEQGKAWRSKYSMPPPSVFNNTRNWIKITIDREGVYKITGNDLIRAGVWLTNIDVNTMKLFAFLDDTLPSAIQDSSMPDMVEIPFEGSGLTDSSFDRNDYIIFFARAPQGWRPGNNNFYYFIHPFATSYAIWLTWGWGSHHKSILDLPTYSGETRNLNTYFAMKHFEADLVWQGGISWVWDEFASRTFYFIDQATLPEDSAFIIVKPPASSIYINGIPASYISATGAFFTNKLTENSQLQINYTGEQTLDYFDIIYKRYLRADDNTLQIFSPASPGAYRYILTGFSSPPKVYDITDPVNVRAISCESYAGNQYMFADSSRTRKIYLALTENKIQTPYSIEIVNINSLRSPENSADMLILTSDQLDPSRLAEFHRQHDSLKVKLIKISDIMNEFGFGIYDPNAVRDLILYAYRYWQSPAISYVILVGDGHYDYRNLLNSPRIYFPPAGRDRSFSDDWFVRTSDPVRGVPSIAIGRISVRSNDELESVTDKIIKYASEPETGWWRNTFLLAGDDEYVGYEGNQPEHTLQTDELSQFIYPLANIRNIFMIEFPMHSNLTKPEAREELIKLWNEGAIVVNYIGHGNYHLWAHEILFDSNSDVVRLRNGRRLPMMFSASCSVGEFYEPFRESTSEKLLRHTNGGSIISIAATGLTGSDANFSLNSRLFRRLFIQARNLSCGLNLVSAKLEGAGIYQMNDAQYLIIGDPALKLALPNISSDSFSVTPETLKAPGWMTAYGYTSVLSGEAQIYVYDAELEKHYTLDRGRGVTITYHKQGSPIFRGARNFENGQFTINFFIPKDVSYGSVGAKVIAYIVGENSDNLLGKYGIPITGNEATTTIDTTGPKITAWIDDPSFRNGDIVSSTPTLYAELSDTHGINITGGLGHTIYLSLDNGKSIFDLTGYFHYYDGSSTTGSLHAPLGKLSPGEHTLFFRAWDNLNNSSSIELNFKVQREEQGGIVDILPYPSPFKDYTFITFRLLSPAEVSLDIFTITGRKIWSAEKSHMQVGYNQIKWEGADRNGKRVSRGIYIYRLVAKNNEKDYIIYGKLCKE